MLPKRERIPPNIFKDYEPGNLLVDIMYPPQMKDEASRRYLFVAIDSATRWVYGEIKKDEPAKSAKAFMNQVTQQAPFKIHALLADNDGPLRIALVHRVNVNPPGSTCWTSSVRSAVSTTVYYRSGGPALTAESMKCWPPPASTLVSILNRP